MRRANFSFVWILLPLSSSLLSSSGRPVPCGPQLLSTTAAAVCAVDCRSEFERMLMAVASVVVRAWMHLGGHATSFSMVKDEERGPKSEGRKARNEGRRPEFRGRNRTQKRGRRAEGPTSEVETEVDRSLLCESAPPPCHMSNRVEPYPSTRGSVHGITLPPAGATTRRLRCLTIHSLTFSIF